MLLRTLGTLQTDDVLVLDRGYPAWWLFAALQAKGIEGCNWPSAEQLLKSSQHELVVQQRLNSTARKKLRKLGLPEAPSLRLRFIKVPLPNGRLEILATSLLDPQRYSAHAFGPLYRSRWGMEEAFKSLKHRLHLEGFSGELPQAIEQEIQAKALMYNIGQALCTEAAQHICPGKQGH